MFEAGKTVAISDELVMDVVAVYQCTDCGFRTKHKCVVCPKCKGEK